jgi:hypothetical protein
MQLLEAFNAMEEMGEVRLVELAQVLAERFPKRNDRRDGYCANDDVVSNLIACGAMMPFSVHRM